MPDENINISDVIEVIQTDPYFSKSPAQGRGNSMYQAPGPSTADWSQPSRAGRSKPYVEIVEQPASKALRFRYECEGRSAGSIPGANSTSDNKTFPTIRVVGHDKGKKAVVVVSCVTKDSPYRAHPHNLVGREGCKKGVCTLEIPSETMTMTFSNLGIQCVKKKDIEAHLKTREDIRVDPFKKGFHHRNQPTSIDLNAVRLCFQVFIEDSKGKFTVPLDPVVSEPIYDKKAMSDLTIVKLSDCVSPVDGGRKDIILLCEKVAKEDIQIRFFEEKDGNVVWEAFGDFQPSQVHKQTAIWFKTPKYNNINITEPVKVFIQLRRPSDNALSEALPFEFLPLDSGIRRKRKYEPDPNSSLLRPSIQEPDTSREAQQPSHQYNIAPVVKAEPPDMTPLLRSPNYTGGGYSPHYIQPSISPQLPYNITIVPTADIPYHNPYSVNNNITRTPPPPQQEMYNINYIPNNNLEPLPSISSLQSPMWNMQPQTQQQQQPNDPQLQSNAMNIDATTSILNLDSRQLQELNLNSDELPYNHNYDANSVAKNLSESFSNNLSISDMPKDNNMTDSLTEFAKQEYDRFMKNGEEQ